MRATLVPTITIAALCFGVVGVAADLQSGLQVGDSANFFLVKDCTGPSAGKSLCYR